MTKSTLVFVLLMTFAILAVSAKRSKRSFIEEIVELADSERGGSFRMPTIAPMSFRMPTVSAPMRMPTITSFAPKLPTFTSFAPSYRMPSFSSPMFGSSFSPMRMPSFATPRFPSFAPMRMPSFNAPRSPSYAPAGLPTFARMPMPSFRPNSFGAPSKLGQGRINFMNYANRRVINHRNVFGTLPNIPQKTSFGSRPHQIGHGRFALRNYVNRFSGRNPFGSLPSVAPRNPQGRLPFFANPRNQPQRGRGFNPIGRNSRLPFFARQRNPNFIPTRSMPIVGNRNPLRNIPQTKGKPTRESPSHFPKNVRGPNNREPSSRLGGRAKSKPKLDSATFNRIFNRFINSKEGKAFKSTFESITDPVDKVKKFINPYAMSNFKIDRDFLERVEGNKLEGYVPKTKEGHSGVTVGTGFDIGQRSKSDLQALGFPKKLVDKLAPYTNKILGEASNFLKKNPLKITPDEARMIDTAVMHSGISKLARDYDSAANGYPGSTRRFYDLPKEVQTVAYSVHHQYGDTKSKTPGFFDQLARNDYKAMVNNLRNFKDAYSTRRNLEADLIQNIGKK